MLEYFANMLAGFAFGNVLSAVVLAIVCLIAVKLILKVYDKMVEKSKIDLIIRNILRIAVNNKAAGWHHVGDCVAQATQRSGKPVVSRAVDVDGIHFGTITTRKNRGLQQQLPLRLLELQQDKVVLAGVAGVAECL